LLFLEAQEAKGWWKMFHDLTARLAMKRSKAMLDERRDSPRFDIPLSVRIRPEGGFEERFGRLSVNGFYFETEEILKLGQQVELRVVLHGLGLEVAARGRVISLAPAGSHVGVAARFEEIPFETERMIARWLDLMAQASTEALAI
jgi:hypothetical protein